MHHNDTTIKQISKAPSALNAVAANMLYVLLSLYLIFRHWHTVNVYAVILIFAPLGIQLCGQFLRAGRIVRLMAAAQVEFATEVFDLLFWGAIGNILLLIFIAALLKHIDGFI